MAHNSPAFVMATSLQKIDAAMQLLGMRNNDISTAASILILQDEELKRLRARDTYQTGYKDGWEAAFLSGLPGDDVPEGEHDGRAQDDT